MKNKNFKRKEKFIHQFYIWVGAWVSIIDSIITIFTLGFFNYSFWIVFMQWYTSKEKDKKLARLEKAYIEAVEVIEREMKWE